MKRRRNRAARASKRRRFLHCVPIPDLRNLRSLAVAARMVAALMLLGTGAGWAQTINTTRWSPDTCGCTFEYTWDAEVPENLRVHTFKSESKVCPEHVGLTGEAHFNLDMAENQTKNLALARALETISALAQTTPEGAITLKSGLTYNWSFSGTGTARRLQFVIEGATLSNAQKTQLRNAFVGLPKPVDVL